MKIDKYFESGKLYIYVDLLDYNGEIEYSSGCDWVTFSDNNRRSVYWWKN